MTFPNNSNSIWRGLNTKQTKKLQLSPHQTPFLYHAHTEQAWVPVCVVSYVGVMTNPLINAVYAQSTCFSQWESCFTWASLEILNLILYTFQVTYIELGVKWHQAQICSENLMNSKLLNSWGSSYHFSFLVCNADIFHILFQQVPQRLHWHNKISASVCACVCTRVSVWQRGGICPWVCRL